MRLRRRFWASALSVYFNKSPYPREFAHANELRFLFVIPTKVGIHCPAGIRHPRALSFVILASSLSSSPLPLFRHPRSFIIPTSSLSSSPRPLFHHPLSFVIPASSLSSSPLFRHPRAGGDPLPRRDMLNCLGFNIIICL